MKKPFAPLMLLSLSLFAACGQTEKKGLSQEEIDRERQRQCRENGKCEGEDRNKANFRRWCGNQRFGTLQKDDTLCAFVVSSHTVPAPVTTPPELHLHFITDVNPNYRIDGIIEESWEGGKKKNVSGDLVVRSSDGKWHQITRVPVEQHQVARQGELYFKAMFPSDASNFTVRVWGCHDGKSYGALCDKVVKPD